MSADLTMIVFLALALVIALPLLSAKTGRSVSSLLFGKRRKERGSAPAQATAETAADSIRNDSRKELLAFVAEVNKTARKQGVRIVCPGTLEAQGQAARFSFLMVTGAGITGVYCLGYGGRIFRETDGAWKQRINGEEKYIADPVAVCAQWKETAMQAMKAAGEEPVPFRAVAVFTNCGAMLETAQQNCWGRADFLNNMKQISGAGDSAVTDVNGLAGRLTGLTARTARSIKANSKK